MFRKVTIRCPCRHRRGHAADVHPRAGDYVNASRDFLGGPDTQMMGNVIEANFLVLLNYPAAAALSIILMAAILVLVGIYVKRSGTRTCCERRSTGRRRARRLQETSRRETGTGRGRDAGGSGSATGSLPVCVLSVRLPAHPDRTRSCSRSTTRSSRTSPGAVHLLDKWLNVCNVEGGAVCEAFANSIVIGVVATVIATDSAR